MNWGGDKAKKDLIRAVLFLESLVYNQPRNAQLVKTYEAMTNTNLGFRIDGLLLALEPGASVIDMAKHRPLCPGASISGGDHNGPGTIACFVRCNATHQLMLLGNEHVVRAEFGTAKPGPGTVIRQPAKFNGGLVTDRCGVYVRGILDARMDAAVAVLDNGITWTHTMKTGRTLAGAGALPQVGDPVFKVGAMSGMTSGTVSSVTKATTVNHAKFGAPIAFTNQIEVMPIVAQNRQFQIPGDSGSALYNANFEVIGLMHGGDMTVGSGIAAPIHTVLTALNVALA
jgi:hypothetical protein